MAVEDITPQERIESLEAWLDYFRVMLDETPARGFDSAKKRAKIVKAINRTRDDLVIARMEADLGT